MPQNNRPLLIGITGNIGSGKSTFAGYVSAQGYTVISADQVVKDLYRQDETHRSLTDRWGEQILTEGKPDPSKIASIVFKQPTELAFLNSVIHPGVLKEFSRSIAEAKEAVLFFEVPLLFEAKLQKCFDFVILITTGAYTRELRLINRDKSDPQAIRERLASQQDDESKKSLADLVISNDGSPAALRKRCLRFLKDVPAIPKRKVIPFSSIPAR